MNLTRTTVAVCVNFVKRVLTCQKPAHVLICSDFCIVQTGRKAPYNYIAQFEVLKMLEHDIWQNAERRGWRQEENGGNLREYSTYNAILWTLSTRSSYLAALCFKVWICPWQNGHWLLAIEVQQWLSSSYSIWPRHLLTQSSCSFCPKARSILR